MCAIDASPVTRTSPTVKCYQRNLCLNSPPISHPTARALRKDGTTSLLARRYLIGVHLNMMLLHAPIDVWHNTIFSHENYQEGLNFNPPSARLIDWVNSFPACSNWALCPLVRAYRGKMLTWAILLYVPRILIMHVGINLNESSLSWGIWICIHYIESGELLYFRFWHWEGY